MRAIVIVSADIEWRATLSLFPDAQVQESPLGQWFTVDAGAQPVVVFHGGWGKIAAAATAQYVVDRWSLAVLLNLGTCAGFEGMVERGEILSWLGAGLPLPMRRSLIVSADRDLIVHEVDSLRKRFGAVAGDWESGAIAWVATRNAVRCLILSGVSDLVGPSGAEAYGDVGVFVEGATRVLKRLFAQLPAWVALGLAEKEVECTPSSWCGKSVAMSCHS